MRRKFIWLATASIAYGSPHVFSVTDDLLAYPQVTSPLRPRYLPFSDLPQYEVIFSDTFISDKDAESRLAYAAPFSSAKTETSSATSQDATTSNKPTAELSNRRQHPDASDPNSNINTPEESFESMILHGKPYLCSIPSVPPPTTNKTTHAQAVEEETAELARATNRGYDLLKSMSGNCLYFISGWWSYSFCYNTHVKQFHQLPPGKGAPPFPPVEDPATPSYVLGKFGEKRNRFVEGEAQKGVDSGLPPEEGEGVTTEIQAKGTASSRYLSQKLSGGTTCDLTGSPRRVEIQFHCHPQSADRIGWIKEVSTCSYLMVIYTPRLCNDVAFLPPREEKAEGIVCREVVKEEDIPEWEARKASEAERKLVGANTNTASKPFVGSIEVGGMKLVGTEGRKLETPNNIQPGSHGHNMQGSGPEPNVREIARQDSKEAGGQGQRLTDAELKKMGLDPKVVDAARKELEAFAEGKGWHLEVFDIEDGKELRGVVEGDEDEEGAGEYRGGVDGVGDGDGGGEGGESGEREGEEGSQEEYKDEL
ncbi:Protein OS-9 [Mycoblastus sanguinarius]|nr:Protein OS-9 [Mycoblastus sanguinarius]